MRAFPRSAVIALGLSGALLLAGMAGCSGSSTTASSAAAGPQPAAPQAAVADQAAGSAGKVVGSKAGQAAIEPKIIRTASLYLTVTDVGTAAVRARAIASGMGGAVLDESINATAALPSVPGGPSPATPSSSTARRGNSGYLTLSIPSAKLDQALDQLAEIGTVVQRTSGAKDVTATYVDVESRVATKKASIDRVRALLAQAKDIQQIVAIESELANREAELESLQAQLAALSSQVAMSTVTVALSSNPDSVVAEESTGFMSGLKSGWAAFLASVRVALTVLGAILPFLVVAALIYLAYRAWRRNRAARTATSPPGPGQPTGTTAHPPVREAHPPAPPLSASQPSGPDPGPSPSASPSPSRTSEQE